MAQDSLTHGDMLVISMAQWPLDLDGPCVEAGGQFFGVEFAGGTFGPAFITDLHQPAIFCAVRCAPIMFPTELTK